jgi:polysaccharide chain length determinant protein (PEP-CTERM system associated)
MLGHRELAMEDYAEMFKRRKWLILVVTLGVLVVSVVVSSILPPRYESQTLVLIEQQKVPEDYVKPVLDEDLGARLASMKEQILSRSRIEPIITKFNLFSSNGSSMDERVERTRKAIKITQIHSEQARSSGSMPGFFISFDAQDARTAQQVCGEITSLFVSENLHAREQSAEGTSDFLKQQLEDAKRKLDEQDAKLAAFQEKYLGRLPGQEASNSNSLQALTTQLDASTQSLNRMQQSETFIQAMISQQSQQLQSAEPIATITADERKKELKSLKEQKAALDAIYTPDHPDVVAMNRRIADLEAQMAKPAADPTPAPDATGATMRPDPPQLQQLKAQLSSVEASIASARKAQGGIEAQIRNYESRIEASPQVEEEYKQITRDHDTALGFYDSLLQKMNMSSMATALEQRQQGEQFIVMDAPNLPDAPTFPNRYIFAGGGFAGGLFLGLLLAAILEYRDVTLRNERDIWAFTKLPTLAVVSHINDLPRPEKPKGLWKRFSRSPKSLESAGV